VDARCAQVLERAPRHLAKGKRGQATQRARTPTRRGLKAGSRMPLSTTKSQGKAHRRGRRDQKTNREGGVFRAPQKKERKDLQAAPPNVAARGRRKEKKTLDNTMYNKLLVGGRDLSGEEASNVSISLAKTRSG